MKNRQWLLARRPDGAIKDSDFKLVETDAPTPREGEVLVRNLMLSCDPTQRGWIAFDTYLPAVKIGEVVRSLGAGRVVTSNHPDFAVGDLLSGLVGWRRGSPEFRCAQTDCLLSSFLNASCPKQVNHGLQPGCRIGKDRLESGRLFGGATSQCSDKPNS
jgi:hypothetical protein